MSKHCRKIFEQYTSGFSMKGYLGLTFTNSEGEQVPITPEEFNLFVEQVAAVFPDGFTIYDAVGGFSFEGQTFIEPTKVLEVVAAKRGFRRSLRKFEALIEAYTIEFHQTSQFITVNKVQFLAK